MVDGDVHGSMQDRKQSGLGGGAGVRFRQVEQKVYWSSSSTNTKSAV